MTKATTRGDVATKVPRTRRRGLPGRKTARSKMRTQPIAKTNNSWQSVSATILAAVEQRFHNAIRGRVREFKLPMPSKLPTLAKLKMDGKGWLPIPGTYGGFDYAWDRFAKEPSLVAISRGRVPGDSQRYVITAGSLVTVDEDDGPWPVPVEPGQV